MTRNMLLRPALASALMILCAAAASGQSCETLEGREIGGLAIDEVRLVAEDGDVPGHCRITGKIEETIGVEIRLPNPTVWNGKFNGVGNGAFAGFINDRAMDQALARGYATASTDTGHVGNPAPEGPQFMGFDASWALDLETGELDMVALENFGHRAVHLMTVAAKAVIEADSGEPPRLSYFTGCSQGGQLGLSEAQRYPEDYDGIVAGAPANHPVAMWPGEIYPAVIARQVDADQLAEKLEAVNAASLNQCDALDGVADGLIGDPRACAFDAASVPELTAAEARVINLVREGFHHPGTGALVWPGFEPGGEAGWAGHLQRPYPVPAGYLGYMVFRDPGWSFAEFDVTDPETYATVEAVGADLAPILEATDPDLSAFAAAGGKMILWHGWNDQAIAPRNTINYVDAVRETLGPEAADDMLRLFMLPGLMHCARGPGFTEFDALGALEAWVERGVAPATLRASSPELGLVRDICAYPAKTVYLGGAIADPASYACE